MTPHPCAHQGRRALSLFVPAIYPANGGKADGELYPRTGGPFGLNGAFWYVRLSAAF
jgi:hypothetical protein